MNFVDWEVEEEEEHEGEGALVKGGGGVAAIQVAAGDNATFHVSGGNQTIMIKMVIFI